MPDPLEEWEAIVAAWRSGDDLPSEEIRAWREGYTGSGEGRVDTAALPELYHGNIDAEPRAAVLALNPGKVQPTFQHRTGIFDREIGAFGSYRSWAASWPYLRDPWVTQIGRNQHHERRLAFLQRWYGDQTMPAEKMVSFQMYPWHSTRINGPFEPPVETVRRFVLRPLVALGIRSVFAFGKPWMELLENHFGLRVVDRLGAGGRDYGSNVPTRSVVVFKTDDLHIVAMKHNAPRPGPPNALDTHRLRAALPDLD